MGTKMCEPLYKSMHHRLNEKESPLQSIQYSFFEPFHYLEHVGVVIVMLVVCFNPHAYGIGKIGRKSKVYF